jgi:hypothetical protein
MTSDRTDNRDGLGGFEEKLLGQLRTVVEQRKAEQSGLARARTPLWRRPRVVSVASAGALAVGAAVGLPLLGGESTTPSATAAYTVTTNDDGTVTASVRRLEDAEGLERQLEVLGIPSEVDFSPAGMQCEQPRFTRAQHVKGAVVYEFADPDAAEDVGHEVPFTATVDPNRLGRNQTVVIEAGYWQAEPVDGGGVGMWAEPAVADGPVKPCTLVPDDDNAPPNAAY